MGRGQVELLTGGFYEPILAVLPDHDKVGQIQRLTDFLVSHFGVRPRGMWLAERVWEPHLPRAIRQAGVEYVLVDDSHFGLAGLDPDVLGGYYLTEDQGVLVGIFPINQQLRYLIPFAEVEASVEYLERRRGQVAALTIVDDGEKFGDLAGHVPARVRGGLARSLLRSPARAALAAADHVRRDHRSASAFGPGLPADSLLPGDGGVGPARRRRRELGKAKHEMAALAQGERWQRLLRGGFWRTFLVKYPEVADTYWKMLRLSDGDRAGRGRTRRRRAPEAGARLALWRGQANDAYWHGVFGGCYLPHLRRAVKQALLEAERLLAAGHRRGERSTLDRE